MTGVWFVQRKYSIEANRWMRWDRMENLKDKPAYHYSNRGGVLIEKQFVGFEKYFRNSHD
jgi:hypothetical protein